MTQRLAVSLVANLCKHVPLSLAPKVAQDVSSLKALLSYDDTKIVESAVLAMTRLIRSFRHNNEALQSLHPASFATELITKLMKKSDLRFFFSF